MSRTALLGLGAIALVLALSPAQARSAENSLTVDLDRSTRVALSAPVQSIIVANPKVADVTVTDARTLFVTGKGYGSTEIIAIDSQGRTVLQTQVVVGSGSSSSVRLWRGTQVATVACGSTCAPAQKTDAAVQD